MLSPSVASRKFNHLLGYLHWSPAIGAHREVAPRIVALPRPVQFRDPPLIRSLIGSQKWSQDTIPGPYGCCGWRSLEIDRQGPARHRIEALRLSCPPAAWSDHPGTIARHQLCHYVALILPKRLFPSVREDPRNREPNPFLYKSVHIGEAHSQLFGHEPAHRGLPSPRQAHQDHVSTLHSAPPAPPTPRSSSQRLFSRPR